MAPNTQVWVNLKSGKYFRPGSTYYGNTKQGQYMTEAQAQQQGYIEAKGQSEKLNTNLTLSQLTTAAKGATMNVPPSLPTL